MTKQKWVKHDVSKRKEAAKFFSTGLGWKASARQLNLSKSTVKYWYLTWQAVGEEVFFQVANRRPKSYGFETKLAAVQAIVKEGRTYREVMNEFNIVSETPLRRWVRTYSEGGEDALKPKNRKPRPSKKSQVKGKKKSVSAREKKLMEENEYLRTEVEYLKKLRALMESETV